MLLRRKAPRKSLERPSRKVTQSLEKPSRKVSLKSLERPSRKAFHKSLDETSKKTSQKGLKVPSSKAFHKSLDGTSKKTSQKGLKVPSSKSSQKGLKVPSSKSSQKGLKVPSSKSSQKGLKVPSSKSSQKGLKVPSSKSSQKGLKVPSSKSSQKSLKMPSSKSSQKRLERPSGRASQNSLEKPRRKASKKTSKMPPSKASLKSLEKPPKKASKKTSKMPQSKVSQKILESNSKAVVLAPQKDLEINSKASGHRQTTFCVICKRNFTSKKLLNEHNAKHHFLRHCPNCPKTFKQSRKFIFHLRSHLEDHPYECKICLESFNQKRDLLLHKVVHRSSSRLRCDICPEVFPHLASLNRHRLAHNGPPYPCDDCGAIFSNVPDRTVHSKNHVHRCILCPKEVVAFPSNVDLVTHMFKVHRSEEIDPDESEAMDAFEPCVSTGAVKLDDDDSDGMEGLSSSDHESDADIDSDYQKDAVEPVYNLKRKDKFLCFICYDLYPSCELLKSHMKAHNWYPCNSCSRFFPNTETFRKHRCDFSQVPSFRCPNCNSECENCKTGNNIAEVNISALQSIVPRFPELPRCDITDYTDVAKRNCLINFIQHIKSQNGFLDQKSYCLIGYHLTCLNIILKDPMVNQLFPRHCIHDIQELFSKFQNLIQIMQVRVN